MGGGKAVRPQDKPIHWKLFSRYIAIPIARVLDPLSTRFFVFRELRNLWPSFAVGALFVYGVCALVASGERDGIQGPLMSSPYYRRKLNAERGGDPRVQIGKMYEGGDH
eukprot:TRINITY_DN26185_c0_g1_i1.p1 TRINITY_DN26185_c0_g1~~TRINITY_DN26185_c0_g1_i1.p1  ORF type:complete len:109 (-),score=11.17 TRINITY_DN26185_c0_g1_i1:96-422(-)